MDELDALKILRGEKPTAAEPTTPYRRPESDLKVYLVGAAIGFLLFTIIYFIIHPIDRFAIKLALYDNYSITTTVKDGGSLIMKNQMKADGNLVYFNGVYYELGEDRSYKYVKGDDGLWHRYIYYRGSDEISTIETDQLLNKENYTRSFFPWAPMEYKGELMDLINPRIQVTAGSMIISGEIKVVEGGWYVKYYYTTVEINGFGISEVELPEDYIVH